MKFAPKIPAWHVKRELTDAPPTAMPATAGSKKEPRVQQQQPIQKPRQRMELIQCVTGPFAQGAASLQQQRTAYGGGADNTDGWVADVLEALEVTDYNEWARDRGVDVQTEETALRELAEVRWVQLDCGAGTALSVGQGGGSSSSSDGQLVVLQIPQVLVLELGREAQERHQARAAGAVIDTDVGAEVADVKPATEQLRTAEAASNAGPAGSIGPAGSTAAALDNTPAAVDGRAGTLVVLRPLPVHDSLSSSRPEKSYRVTM
ncbi:hypothetical protein H4R19_002568 [Coemansia spiralis]|nr:hypothetical protein H4R19_002568 [Coemansia spiralis]